jgi:hypothetical protein
MDFLKQNKIPILLGVVLLAALYVYMAYFSSPTSATLTASDSSTSVSQDLLLQLQNLHTIKLDNSIFSEPAFQSLTDFGVTIPPEAVGRRNPFLPLGSSGGGSGIAPTGLSLPNTK